jgi:uncharacterized protein (UPF0332 family)
MNPKEFLVFAQNIPKNSKAASRSAISRAYYAAFHEGQELLKLIGIELTKPAERREIHILTYTCLDSSRNEFLVEAGRLLRDLHRRRIEADYRLDKENVESEAVVRDCLVNAEEIVSLLDQPFPDYSLQEARHSIENWLKTKFGRL